MTTPNPALRDRYLADSITTASPAKLLLMLYDRLVLDLRRGEESLVGGERPEANKQLLHAQDIVMELRMSLDVNAWDGAARLANLYVFLLSELMQANVAGDAARVASCRNLVEPLRDAWREAAGQISAAVPAG